MFKQRSKTGTSASEVGDLKWYFPAQKFDCEELILFPTKKIDLGKTEGLLETNPTITLSLLIVQNGIMFFSKFFILLKKLKKGIYKIQTVHKKYNCM